MHFGQADSIFQALPPRRRARLEEHRDFRNIHGVSQAMGTAISIIYATSISGDVKMGLTRDRRREWPATSSHASAESESG